MCSLTLNFGEKIILIYMSCVFAGTSARNRSPSTVAMELFEQHQGTHILQVRNKKKTITSGNLNV